MSTVTSRILHLLGLLQERRVWSAADLADQLGVTSRSVRRDVDRLRSMGYPVHAVPGRGGGYRLGAGRALPPLLLAPEEATAVAVGLRLAASSGIDGLEGSALRALTTLDPLLPPAVRGDVGAIAEVLDVIGSPRARIASPVLVTLARAVRDGLQLRVDYERRDGHRALRRIEPYRVMSVEGRWYLFCYDLDREDWRTFRLDRMHEVRTSTFPIRPRRPPEDIEATVRESLTQGPYPHSACVRVRRPLAEVAPQIPALVGTVEADGEESCLLRTGASDLRWIALHLARMGLPIEVVDPPELREVLDDLAAWFAEATPR